MNIHGRIAVVSGGSSGIGKGTAKALARRAPFIPILSADEVGEAIAKAIEKKQRVLILPPLMNALVRLNAFFPGLVESMLRRTFMPKGLFGNGRPQGN